MTYQELKTLAVKSKGKQELLAMALDMGPSALSRKLNGETGWAEKEIETLLDIAGCEIIERGKGTEQIETLKEAIKILVRKNTSKSAESSVKILEEAIRVLLSLDESDSSEHDVRILKETIKIMFLFHNEDKK